MKWNPDSKILIQGIADPLAAHYAARMKAYGTNLVAAVSAGWGGQRVSGIPTFDLVEEAIAQVGTADIGLIFDPPYQVLDAALEAMAAGIRQVVIVSRGVPPLDMVRLLAKAQATQTFILGSGSPGLIVPDRFWLGTAEAQFYTPGPVGLIGRTHRLADEVARQLTRSGLGQSLAVGLGTDGIVGSSFDQWLQILEEDEATEAIVLLGGSDGSAEMAAAEYIRSAIEKPVIAYIAGVKAPLERGFGDAATVIASRLSHAVPATSSVQQALAAFKHAKVKVAKRLTDIPRLVREAN